MGVENVIEFKPVVDGNGEAFVSRGCVPVEHSFVVVGHDRWIVGAIFGWKLLKILLENDDRSSLIYTSDFKVRFSIRLAHLREKNLFV